MCHNFITQLIPNPKEDVEYTPKLAMVISHVMRNIKNKKMAEGESFGQQYILQKGLKKFGDRGSKAATKEMDQLQQINCFTPIDVAELKPQEKRKAMEYLMFLNKKCDKPIKVKMVYNGKQNQEWLSREYLESPTAVLESIMRLQLLMRTRNKM